MSNIKRFKLENQEFEEEMAEYELYMPKRICDKIKKIRKNEKNLEKSKRCKGDSDDDQHDE